MKPQNKALLLMFFLVLGATSIFTGDALANFVVDKLDCIVQMPCSLYNQFKTYIASKFFAYLIYHISLTGFTGTILWLVEDMLLDGFKTLFKTDFNYRLSRLIGDKLATIFEGVFFYILCWYLINWMGDYIGVTEFFETVYGLFNE